MKNNLAHANSTPASAEADKKITVVQCPACQTKFAVDGALLASLEIPRFHCSRCDNVFALDRVMLGLDRAPVKHEETPEPPSFRPPIREVPKPAPVAEDIDDEYQFAFNFPPEDPHQDVEVKTFDFGSTDFEETDSRLSMTGDDFGVSVMKDPYEREELNPVSGAELESKLFGGLTPGQLNSPEFNHNTSSSFLQPDPTSLGDEPMGYAPLNRGGNTRSFTQDWTDSYIGQEVLSEPTIAKAPSRSGFFSRLSPQWRGCAMMATPIVGFLFILSLLSAYFISNPQAASSTAQSLFPGKETAPPQDLFITNSKIKRVNLESGETVSVVTGTIVNHSENSFNQVFVEGLLFDRTGSLISRKKINAASSLGRSRIQSLSPEMIEDLQNSKPAKRFELRKGQEFEFTMAVPEELSLNAKGPSYFSARIYSVRTS